MSNTVWAGTVRVGLLSIGVRMGSGTESNRPEFHQFTPAGNPLGYKPYDKVTGLEVQRSDIRKGWQAADKSPVIYVTPEDEAACYGEKDRDAEIVCFASVADIPDEARMGAYLVQPSEGGGRAYALLVAVLTRKNRVAVLREWGVRGKKRMAVLSARDGYLWAEPLYWAEELVKPEPAPEYAFSDAELKLAGRMVDGLTEKFEHAAYLDEGTAKMNALIESRIAGQPAAKPEKSGAEQAQDLMSVLAASIEDTRAKRAGNVQAAPAGPKPPVRKRAPRKPRVAAAA